MFYPASLSPGSQDGRLFMDDFQLCPDGHTKPGFAHTFLRRRPLSWQLICCGHRFQSGEGSSYLREI